MASSYLPSFSRAPPIFPLLDANALFHSALSGWAASISSNNAGPGDTGAPEVAYNPIPREHYHTDWVADRTIAYLDSLGANENWFIWMSFPDPHHPWDPPVSAARRIKWRGCG